MPKRSKRLSKKTISEVSVSVQGRSTDFRELARSVLDQVASFPQIKLFPERKVLIDVIRSENEDTFVRLIEALSHKYLSLYPTFKGKEAYLDLQVHWFDYVRTLGADVDMQCLQDAQIEASPCPGMNEWLTIVTSAMSESNISKESQFAMIHAFARLVYWHHQ